MVIRKAISCLRDTLLFDEIEKAHPLVLDLLLQMLDPGRITLANGETLSLEPYFVVMTSNIGGPRRCAWSIRYLPA